MSRSLEPSATTSLTVAGVVLEMTRILSPLGDAARGEARELIALLHDEPRHWAQLSADVVLTPVQADIAMHAARRRAAGAPIQYAAGRAAFRHLVLTVDERVLIPRPETELLVDIVLDRTNAGDGGVVVDVGTGSGAIALALATEGRFERVIATDVSLDALAVARTNAERCAPSLRAPVDFRAGSLLAPVIERGLRAVVSNPPYISFDEVHALPTSVRDWEPSVALFAGDEGMSATATLIRDASVVLAPHGVLALEVDVRRASRVAHLMEAAGTFAGVRVLLDLTGRERFVVARRLEEQG